MRSGVKLIESLLITNRDFAPGSRFYFKMPGHCGEIIEQTEDG